MIKGQVKKISDTLISVYSKISLRMPKICLENINLIKPTVSNFPARGIYHMNYATISFKLLLSPS